MRASAGYDFAICGSTSFAALLAGVLATEGKRVCLIAEPWSPYRLTRRFELSVMLATRPETWALLRRETPEMLKLLNGIGRGLFERVDPLFIAETPASADRLGHMRWTSAAHGYAAERAVDRIITETGSICRIRDAAMLVGGRIEPALADWLRKAGVDQFAPGTTQVAGRRDGTASIAVAGASQEAGTVVLADDDAILTRQPPSDRHRLLHAVPRTAILTESPAKSLSSAFSVYVDRDTTIHQRAMKGPVTAIAGGDPDTAAVRIGASVGTLGPLRRTGQAAYRALETADGAMLIGRSGKSRMTIVAGLGTAAAFLAPAVARYLAGQSSGDELGYFEARDVSKAARRQAVAETEPPAAEDAA